MLAVRAGSEVTCEEQGVTLLGPAFQEVMHPAGMIVTEPGPAAYRIVAEGNRHERRRVAALARRARHRIGD